MIATTESAAADIAAIRDFNRFYTQKIGVLQEGLLDSEFSLAEARVLFEIAQRSRVIASGLAADLALDPGYLSRILKGFERARLVRRVASAADARRRELALTEQGRRAFAGIDDASRRELAGLTRRLSPAQRRELVAAMQTIRALLDPPAESGKFVLRTHAPGDMGWVVQRHGELYAQEYGWDERFEALVARITADFIGNLDPKRERCWIAERGGRRVGSILLVSKTKQVAKLRLLLVEPDARGGGLGRRLIEECIAFARAAGYRRIALWTQRNLDAARHLYDATGFHLVESKAHRSFGHRLVAETWERAL